MCKVKLQSSKLNKVSKQQLFFSLPCNISQISPDAEVGEDALCGITLHRPPAWLFLVFFGGMNVTWGPLQFVDRR